jgi:hypothetical protein
MKTDYYISANSGHWIPATTQKLSVAKRLATKLFGSNDGGILEVGREGDDDGRGGTLMVRVSVKYSGCGDWTDCEWVLAA